MPLTLHYMPTNCFSDENDLGICKMFVVDLFSIVLFLIRLSFFSKTLQFYNHMIVNSILTKGGA